MSIVEAAIRVRYGYFLIQNQTKNSQYHRIFTDSFNATILITKNKPFM